MALKRLSLHHLRNIEAADIRPSPRVNLIYGENGSGKTTLLEAISILGLGRSFRSHKHKPLVQFSKESFTVFGRIDSEGTEISLGVSREGNGSSIYKAQGQLVASAAALAHYLPLQIIVSETFLLLEGSPKVRRQFIDWLAFHVEPSFFNLWKNAQRCLKHRNSLLRRDRIDNFELGTWDKELVHLSTQIHQLREDCFHRFKKVFFQLLSEFCPLDDLDLAYYRGWDKDKDYSLVLSESLERDSRQGFTHAGSHRADLRITVKGQDAAELLSRGQQKLLICALKIAQGLLFAEVTGRGCTYLIDDLPAELDEKHRGLLAHWLDSMKTQIFVTGIEKEALLNPWRDKLDIDLKLFHVEHGQVNAQEKF